MIGERCKNCGLMIEDGGCECYNNNVNTAHLATNDTTPIIMKPQIHIPEDPADANVCDGCQ